MSALHIGPSRPVLNFLKVRNFQPLLVRTVKTTPLRRPPAARVQPSPRPSQKASQVPGASLNSSKQQNALPEESTSTAPAAQPKPSLSSLLSQTDASSNSLLAPVHIPEDPRAILKSNHPSTALLEQSGIVVQRQIEMMNVFLGFEQANKYVILSPEGDHIGYMTEHDGGIAKAMGRQWFRTHRGFVVNVFDRSGKEVLRFQRPFSWINTRIKVYDPVELNHNIVRSESTALVENKAAANPMMDHQVSSLKPEEMRIIGEAHSEWAPLRRKYNLYLAHELHKAQELGKEAIPGDLSQSQQNQVKGQDHFAQFAYVDERFLSWDFSLKDSEGKLIGSVNRNWGGFGREILTDTGIYALRMDAAGLDQESEQKHYISQTHQGDRAYAETLGGNDSKYGMTLDQRAVMLATAVTIDFDYFSRHSHGGGIIPMPLMMGGGGGAAEAGAAGGAAGAAGAGEGAVLGETVSGAGGMVGRGAAGGVAGAGEGAMAGAGSIAGYEAMQRGMEGSGSPQAPSDSSPFPPDQSGQGGEGGDVWGTGDDPWSGASSGGGGDGDGGGFLSSLWDMIFGNS